MRAQSALLLVLGLLLSRSRPATGQATALTVAGVPASMTVATAAAGSQPTASPNAVATYFVRVRNRAGVKKITAQINASMPPGTTLRLTLVPPAGSTSLGPVILTTVSQDVVVNISKINPGTTQGTTYAFSATAAAGVVPSQSRIVTLTLLNYP